MNDKVSIEKVSPKDHPGVVADEIVASINDSIDDHGRCTLALAGGGTPSSVYRLLSRPPRVREIDWTKVQLFWGDERWVPDDHYKSNFLMVQETLLSHIQIPAENVHAIQTNLESPQQAAEAYADEIRKVFGLGQGELPKFDLVLLGLGKDGHIASLFPESSTLDLSGAICHATVAPDDDKMRITLAPDVLINARRLIFIVTGRGKAEVIKRVFEGEESYNQLPAKIYERSQGHVTWFLDTGAALHLQVPTVLG
ncbi:MAG: 6-phosphogluconolactonase [Deltaproteobacteria bacterium]|nr:6-phosphogluconolactonase [Deltaproteobacteria bacterium]